MVFTPSLQGLFPTVVGYWGHRERLLNAAGHLSNPEGVLVLGVRRICEEATIKERAMDIAHH